MIVKFLIYCAFLAFAIAGPTALHSFRSELPSGDEIPVPYQDDFDLKNYRLPNNTIPERYEIELLTNIHNGDTEFDGKVKIRIRATEETESITIHYRQLTIIKIDLLDNDGAVLKEDLNYTSKEDVEFLIINPQQKLTMNAVYHVVITYKGTLRDDNLGFYRSFYETPEGQKRWLATTQFQSTDARHAFPCYDEPQIRTAFSIQLTHDASYKAISNMPEATRNPVEGTNYVATKFEDTLPVQTYLIAFVVSDFKSLDRIDINIPQRVFAKPQSIDGGEAELALDVGKKLLDMFAEHFGVAYRLPKMDQVAVPDFDAGAMENWGLVTYREEYLLFNPEIGTLRQRTNVITIISHEYSHQWFGNHVSPKWWSYIWLNEGFATLYENYMASLAFPEDRLMDTFVVDSVQTVLEVDASPNIRPMTYYVENPERISRLFDRVAYDKSGSVLRMMQTALGVSTWTKGLKNYLNAREFKAATSDDLYAGLQQAIDEDFSNDAPNVETIMRTWETQSGYPVIHVSRNGNQLILTQERFFYSNTSSSNNVWWVPINYVVGSNANFTSTKPDLWMNTQKITLENSSAPKPWTENDWIVLNIQQTGYYRVNYDDNLWELIIKQLNGNGFDNIHLLNRAQLIDDSLNLARAGEINYSIPFNILRYLSKEFDYIPWASANRGILLLNRLLSGASINSKYQAFVRTIVEPLFNKFGIDVIEGEPKLDRYARSVAINIACQAGLESCLTQTANRLQEVMETNITIAPDLQSVIYCNGLRSNETDSRYFYLQNKLFQSEDQAERTMIILALGCSQNSLLLYNFLNLAIIPNALRLQEKLRVFTSPVNNGELGLRVMINFLKNNYREVENVSSGQVNTMFASIASRISSEELLAEFNVLLNLTQTSLSLTESELDNYRASALSNLNWKLTNLAQIEEILNELNTTTVLPPTTTVLPPSTTVLPPATTILPPATTTGAESIILSTVMVSFCAIIKFVL